MSVSVSVEDDDAFYRWSCEFVVAHAVFGTGFVTVPVAGVHLASHPHSPAALFFAVFAVFCTSVSLIVCCRFYAELKRAPWPRWLSSSAGHQQRRQDAVRAVVGDDEPPRDVPLRQTEFPVAALAENRIPTSYEHQDGDDASECAVCLGEVGEGQKARRLPACQHVFHEECIDLWLRAQATCPICRSGVTPPPAPPERLPEVVVNVGAGHGLHSATVTVRPSIISSV
ncbi:hypothetical protein ACP70R_029313 [Stipagrostis hirtigluma subsp. patula]